MRMLPFFILSVVIISCSLKTNKDKNTTQSITDTIIPAADTAKKLSSLYDSISDSINIKHQRDSFYAIKPAYLFTTTGENAGFDKLIAAAIDTGAAKIIKSNFTTSTTYKYSKDSLLLSQTSLYSNGSYNIRWVDEDIESYKGFHTKKIFINGKPLRWGINIDTTLTGSDISYYIVLTPEDFRLIKFKQKTFLYLQGEMENCNGNGCGVSFHLLFDPELNKAIALQQYRIEQLYLGKCSTYDQLGFLVFDDYNYNDFYKHFEVSAKAYVFSKNGKVVPARDGKGKQFYFDGYSIDDPDSISILKANFPLH